MRSTDAVTRHDLVWLEPFARAEPAAAHAAEAHIIRRWITMGRPLVATRRRAVTPSDHFDLGLPLPPSQGRLRIALYAPAAAVREVRAAPSLQRVVDAAPLGWQGPLRTLEGAAGAAGIGFRVFGSLAWQYLTGEPYVSDRSDVDLLWRPGIACHLF